MPGSPAKANSSDCGVEGFWDPLAGVVLFSLTTINFRSTFLCSRTLPSTIISKISA